MFSAIDESPDVFAKKVRIPAFCLHHRPSKYSLRATVFMSRLLSSIRTKHHRTSHVLSTCQFQLAQECHSINAFTLRARTCSKAETRSKHAKACHGLVTSYPRWKSQCGCLSVSASLTSFNLPGESWHSNFTWANWIPPVSLSLFFSGSLRSNAVEWLEDKLHDLH